MTASRNALLKPFQLLTIALVCGAFTGFFVFLATHNFSLSMIALGAVFIVALVVLAMLVLSYQPNPDVEVYLDRFDGSGSREGEGSGNSQDGTPRAAAAGAAEPTDRA